MKRLVTLLLCMMLLLAPAALAAGKSATISNMSMAINGDEYTLNGIELVLGFGEADDATGVHLAVNANGETAADLSLELIGNKIIAYAEGISDVYSIDLQTVEDMLDEALEQYGVDWEDIFETIGKELPEMLEKWSASIEKITAVISESVTEDGTVDLNGETATHYVISVSEQNMKKLLDELSDLLDDFVDEPDGVDLDDMNLSVEGTLDVGETMMAAEIRVIERDEATGDTATLVIVQNGTSAEEGGKTTRRMDCSVYVENGDSRESVLTQTTEYYMIGDAITGLEYNAVDEEGNTILIRLTLPEDQSVEGPYALYLLANSEIELNAEMSKGLLHLNLTAPDGSMSLNADQFSRGQTHVAFETVADGETLALSFDLTQTEDEAEWMNTAVETTVDMLTMDEEQSQKLMTELTAKGIELLGALAESSETLAAVLDDAM